MRLELRGRSPHPPGPECRFPLGSNRQPLDDFKKHEVCIFLMHEFLERQHKDREK